VFGETRDGKPGQIQAGHCFHIGTTGDFFTGSFLPVYLFLRFIRIFDLSSETDPGSAHCRLIWIRKEQPMKMQKTTIGALIILTAGVLLSQDRFDMQVRNYFFAGLAGDSASLEKGMKICEGILARDPKQPEALVWHGVGLVSESRQDFKKGDQQNGATLWQRGLDEMDQAEALAPNDLGVRIVRGAVLLIASQ
jgi:hypothetical protein